jgi:hypothetical protein
MLHILKVVHVGLTEWRLPSKPEALSSKASTTKRTIQTNKSEVHIIKNESSSSLNALFSPKCTF